MNCVKHQPMDSVIYLNLQLSHPQGVDLINFLVGFRQCSTTCLGMLNTRVPGLTFLAASFSS